MTRAEHGCIATAISPASSTAKGVPIGHPFFFAIQDNAIFSYNAIFYWNHCFIITPFFLLSRVLLVCPASLMSEYHRSPLLPIHPILPICPNFQFQQPPFCLPSMWVLCAFFGITLTTTKSIFYLFHAKVSDNQHPNIRITHQPYFAHSPH